jgi:hypothetical protein
VFLAKQEVKLCVFDIIQRIRRRSQILHFWRIRGVKQVFSPETRGETVRFRRESGVKQSVSGNNAVFAKIRLVGEY